MVELCADFVELLLKRFGSRLNLVVVYSFKCFLNLINFSLNGILICLVYLVAEFAEGFFALVNKLVCVVTDFNRFFTFLILFCVLLSFLYSLVNILI